MDRTLSLEFIQCAIKNVLWLFSFFVWANLNSEFSRPLKRISRQHFFSYRIIVLKLFNLPIRTACVVAGKIPAFNWRVWRPPSSSWSGGPISRCSPLPKATSSTLGSPTGHTSPSPGLRRSSPRPSAALVGMTSATMLVGLDPDSVSCQISFLPTYAVPCGLLRIFTQLSFCPRAPSPSPHGWGRQM